MKARRITLSLVAAALALPISLVSSPANAANTTTEFSPGTCPIPAFDECTVSYTASTFTGTYTAAFGAKNDTSLNHGTCVEGSSTISQNLCEVVWYGGNPNTLCTPSTTPWYQDLNPPYAWTYIPDTSNPRGAENGGYLFAEGGGVIDDEVIVGTTILYLHIQVEGLCGQGATVQQLLDSVTIGTGLGTVDLSKTYQFEGYVSVG